MIFTPQPAQQKILDFCDTHDRAYQLVGMGLGKTASNACAAGRLRCEGACKGVLVVAPLRVATLTWPNELAKWDFCRNWPVESIRGKKPSGNAFIYTTNYERLTELKNLDFCDTVIFDEITRAKNHASSRIKHFRPLLRSHRRWGLTGTPRPNSLLELFAQIRLLDDGKRLGTSYHAFRQAYFQPTDYMEYNWAPRPGAEEAIYRKIEDFTLTLRTSDYTDVADTVVEDVEVGLPAEARTMYKELEKQLILALPEGNIVASQAATLVNKLLQIAGGTVYSETKGVIAVHDAKVNKLRMLLHRHADQNVIIFTNYVHERERVVRETPGAVDAAKFKGDIEDAWNSGRIKYLVADPRSLGHGLNLQVGGHIAVWFSPNWSREAYDQANARIARKGQDRVPLVYRLISPGTMDDAVVECLHEKGTEQASMLAVLANFRRMQEII